MPQHSAPSSPIAAARRALTVIVAVAALGTAFSTSLESQRTVKQLAEQRSAAPEVTPEAEAAAPSLVVSTEMRTCADPGSGD